MARGLGTMLLCWGILGVQAADRVLLPAGAEWRYRLGTSPVEPGWSQPEFQDDHWAKGRSGFSHGLSLYDAATRLPEPSTYTSVYFRTDFTAPNPAELSWLMLLIDYNDAFVAYLNGKEIARAGVSGPPDQPLPHDAIAESTHGWAVAELFDLTVFKNHLVPGRNVLAIHGFKTASLDHNFSLVPELRSGFSRGPFIQNTAADRTQIIWNTPVPGETTLRYGIDPGALNMTAQYAALNTNHVVTLTNLTPGQTYYYQARSQGESEEAVSPVIPFHTLQTSGPISFAVLGDSGVGSVAQYQLAEIIRAEDPDIVLHVGDVVYPDFLGVRADLRCFSVYGEHMRSRPYYFVLGNHDILRGITDYYQAFYLPTNEATGTEMFYSFDHGDAHFAMLYQPFFHQYAMREGDPQHVWLTNDLANSQKPWKFLVQHHPMASSGSHRWDDWDFNNVPDQEELRQLLSPLALPYGVQLLFSGHDHNYERLRPWKGLASMVTGGGGIQLRGFKGLDPASVQFYLRHHCLFVRLDGDTLSLRAVDAEGNQFDSMFLRRAPSPGQVHTAAWHSPAIERTPPNDGDGNIYGQRFDFIGEPVTAVSGAFSALGRVYVNNDDTFLYVGFEQVMLEPDATVCLFLESPHLEGTHTMLSLGDGIIDPQGQGVDGLEALKNLSFTNFHPAVAALLGDEYADAQYRQFTRPGSTFDTGQGIFRLDSLFSNVEGTRLQQFNRSPQRVVNPAEQNADWIELAVPLAALGDVQPGEQIRIGAVVGVGSLQMNDGQPTRLLDRGFLGDALHVTEPGRWELEGMVFELALNPDSDGDGLEDQAEQNLGTDPDRPDTDGDGLLDGWEVRFGFDPLTDTGEAAADSDGDGHLNAEEQLAGTDPRATASVLKLRVLMEASRPVELLWQAVPGKQYQLEISANPAGTFTPVLDGWPRTAVAGEESFSLDELLDKNDAVRTRFYRIRLLP